MQFFDMVILYIQKDEQGNEKHAGLKENYQSEREGGQGT